VPIGSRGLLDRETLFMGLNMVNVKEAVQAALKYLGDLVPDAKDPRLEEIERNNQDWAITLSYMSVPTPAELAAIIGGAPSRIYRTITIDSQTGEFVSMKIKQLA
jgi:hypothetical protein